MGRKTTCDVPRPAPLGAAELRSLQAMHDDMAPGLGASFSALLHETVEVSLVGIEQAAYGDFIHGLDDDSCISLVKAEPLGDCLLLDIGLPILYPMLDRLLGGGQAAEPLPHRPPTDIELSLASRITRLFLDELCRAWRSVATLTLEVTQVESRPRQLRALPSDEAVVVVGFRLSLGNHRGLAQLCFPCRAIRSVGDKLAAARRENSSFSSSPTADGANATVELSVALAATPITAGELRALRVGDIIVTETNAEHPAEASLDGAAKFTAKPGSLDGRKAIRIVEPR